MATDPDTPYFHVGLNCPPPRRSWISGGVKKISWGVGIQVPRHSHLRPPRPPAVLSCCVSTLRHSMRSEPKLPPPLPPLQNFTRQILPLEDDKGRGDGMLRLQARGNFESRRISHPLERWETPVEFGHEVPASHAPSAEPPQTMRRTWAFRDGHVMCAHYTAPRRSSPASFLRTRRSLLKLLLPFNPTCPAGRCARTRSSASPRP